MGYANHPHDKVRASALDSLAAIISPELRSFYIPFLSDLSVEVRANAISYLACVIPQRPKHIPMKLTQLTWFTPIRQ